MQGANLKPKSKQAWGFPVKTPKMRIVGVAPLLGILLTVRFMVIPVDGPTPLRTRWMNHWDRPATRCEVDLVYPLLPSERGL